MTTDLALVEDQHQGHGLSMVDGPDPMAAMQYAADVSKAIAAVLKEGNGFVKIQGRNHVEASGWQTIAAMTGHTCEIEWSRIVEGLDSPTGLHTWEARAIVRDQSGRVVSTGESMAAATEKAPWTKAEFSIRSMAQTRAMGRALAARMRYVVQLAGFAGAPAEEMSDADREGAAIQVARERFKVLRDVLGQDKDVINERLDGKPERLAEDDHFAYVAFMLGCDSMSRLAADEVVEGEVVEDQDTGEVISESQRKRLFAIAREVGATEEWVKSVVLDLTGQDSRSKIPVSKYEAVIDAIQAGPAAEHVAAGGEALFPADPPRPEGDFQ